MKTGRLSNEDERWSRVRKMKKKKVRYVGDSSLRMTDWKKPLSSEIKKKTQLKEKVVDGVEKNLTSYFLCQVSLARAFPRLAPVPQIFFALWLAHLILRDKAGQRNTIFPPFYFSCPVPYTGAQWCYEPNPNPNPNPTMEELIQSEIFSPFLRSFTKGNSIPSWQCFIRAAFNAYNIMQNRKLTVTKCNFFRQKVFSRWFPAKHLISVLVRGKHRKRRGYCCMLILASKHWNWLFKLLSVLQKTNVLKCVPHVQLKIVQHVWHVQS